MTKINENGQIEWTFEELDFDGAMKEVQIEINNLIVVRNYLISVMPFDNSIRHNILHDEFNSAGVRLEFLIDVTRLIINYKYEKGVK